jgi:hypothetical protein
MELVGLGYSSWFVYRYLLFKARRPSRAAPRPPQPFLARSLAAQRRRASVPQESRKELVADVEELKAKARAGPLAAATDAPPGTPLTRAPHADLRQVRLSAPLLASQARARTLAHAFVTLCHDSTQPRTEIARSRRSLHA